MKKNNAIYNKGWFWALIPLCILFLFFVLLINYAMLAALLESFGINLPMAETETKQQITPTSETQETIEATETIAEEINKSIEAQLKDIIDSLNIKYSDLDIYQDDPDQPQYIIRYLSEESFWNEKDFVISNISDYTNICKEAYAKDINKIELIVYVKLTDPRGNENEEKAFDMCMTKDKFNQYNWENLKYSIINFNVLKSDCENLYIHPGILKNVNTDNLYYK